MNCHMSLHTGQPNYNCDKCKNKFYTPSGLKRHSCERKQWKYQDYRVKNLQYCEFCDSKIATKEVNEAHSCKYQNPNNPKTVVCRCCGVTLLKTTFKGHIAIHEGKWKCKICNKNLASEKSLRVHLTIHTGDRPYTCEKCSKGFTKKENLKKHQHVHGSQVDIKRAKRTFRCEICFKEIIQKKSLDKHLLKHKLEAYKCDICSSKFAFQHELRHHKTNDHPDEYNQRHVSNNKPGSLKPKKISFCNVCEKSFTSLNSLRGEKILILFKC